MNLLPASVMLAPLGTLWMALSWFPRVLFSFYVSMQSCAPVPARCLRLGVWGVWGRCGNLQFAMNLQFVDGMGAMPFFSGRCLTSA